MNKNLFELALELLKPSDWAHFESLASSFLSSEFSDLRTMASPSGDGGRDSELFSYGKKPIVAIQYSVSKDWRSKIKDTVNRLNKEFPNTKIIIYMTNKVIGAKADDLRTELFSQGFAIDIRDCNWFLERYNSDNVKFSAAEELIERIARPYLEGKKIIESKSYSLTSEEARAALLYLGLQWQDDISEKGLSKLSYEALVRAVLRNTDSNNLISRQEIYQKIESILPSTPPDILRKNIDSALIRLTKRYIRHWPINDEFCLKYSEVTRLKERLADKEHEERQFRLELIKNCELCLYQIPEAQQDDLLDLSERVRRVLDRFLLERGEIFASEVLSGDLRQIGFDNLTNIILDDLNQNRPNKRLISKLPNIISHIVLTLLTKPKDATQNYLRCLSDSYTLFAFLKETPDVQSATKKIFSYGEIWLDTTVLLPLFAEVLIDTAIEKRFTTLFKTVTEAGMNLKMIPGVIIEILSHMRISEACSHNSSAEWRGRIPYLFYHYIQSGNNPKKFRNWLELFRGHERPEDDIADYLEQEFNIKRESLEISSKSISDELRRSVERLWLEAHKERREKSRDYDEEITNQLVKHDVENYLGVISLRHNEKVSEFGYKHWWLTLDSIAWQIKRNIKEEFQENAPASPLLSLDFLVNNLAFGPIRGSMTRESEQKLPLLLNLDVSEFMPPEILQVAEKVREENLGLPDYVIRRKVRDACDRAKRQRGCLTKQGIQGIYEF